MNKKSFMALIGGMLAVSACNLNAQPNYTVTASFPAERNNTMAYLLNWDLGQKLDSAVVTDGKVKFTGTTDAPFIGRLIVDGARGPIFIVEEGNVEVSPEGRTTGTPLNDKMEAYNHRLMAIQSEASKLNMKDSTDMVKFTELQNEYQGIPLRAYSENEGNALGLFWFLQMAQGLDLEYIDAAMAEDKILADSKRVQGLRKSFLALEETSVGHHYKDFIVTYNNKPERFSSYIKPGRYTLVDFWASWCGPCIRQTKVIKQLYEKYKDKGLDVVGVAVWDEPENTLKAIKSHKLDWPCMINAQSIPTELYGISGIPCILLINPEGIIVSRDKQNQELIDDVDKAMAGFEPQALVAPADSAVKDTASVTATDVIF
ncbi:MAG: AhpC/TSA family protein [Bacteroides sp.]|nr:AhpC/TSA family protein [Bacteroides sp.]